MPLLSTVELAARELDAARIGWERARARAEAAHATFLQAQTHLAQVLNDLDAEREPGAKPWAENGEGSFP